MSIRLPLQTVFDYNNTIIQGGGPASVAGGVAKQFNVPLVGGGVSATFQTSDDGGTTWYDVQRSSIVSNANGSTAEWMNIPLVSDGVHSFSSVVATGSIQLS